MISYSHLVKDVTEDNFAEYFGTPTLFIGKNSTACFYSLKWKDGGYWYIGEKFLPEVLDSIVAFIEKQSKGGVEISILKRENSSRHLRENDVEKKLPTEDAVLKLRLTDVYKTPLSKYVALYFSFLIIRLITFSDSATFPFVEEIKKELTPELLMLSNDWGSTFLNWGHVLFAWYSLADNKISAPVEAYEKLLDPDTFNEVFKDTTSEFEGFRLYTLSTTERLSQTSCMMKIIKRFKLAEKLVEIPFKDYGRYNDIFQKAKEGEQSTFQKELLLRRGNDGNFYMIDGIDPNEPYAYIPSEVIESKKLKLVHLDGLSCFIHVKAPVKPVKHPTFSSF